MPGTPAADWTAVLVVRAWRQGDRAIIVARITSTTDIARSERVTRSATGRDEIVAAVLEWLDALTSAKGDEVVTDP